MLEMGHHDALERDDRCVNGQCWSGPMLVIQTKGGAVADVKAWIRVMLSRHHNKPTTLGMMDRLTMVHIYEEHAILCVSVAREPDAAILREVYARVMLDHEGVLKSNCATYHFGVVGDGELEKCNALIAHYGWLAGLGERHAQ